MANDYSGGRYRVVGPSGIDIGRIDEDEFVRTTSNKVIYRIDGDEVYEPGVPPHGLKLLATIEDGKAITPEGETLFRLIEDN